MDSGGGGAVEIFGRTASWAQESGQVVLRIANGTSLSADINSSSIVLSVAAASAVPSSPGAYLRVGDELLTVVSVSGDEISVVRGQDGTLNPKP